MLKFFVGFFLFLVGFDVNSITQVTVKVEVIPPPCVINNSQPLIVDFNDILVDKIDGVNYKKRLSYGINCPGGEGLNFEMKIFDSGSLFDPTVFSSSNSNLGFVITKGGKLIAPGQSFVFPYEKQLELTITPVKKAGSILKGGDFSAIYSMMVTYE